ncbi:MAG: penicillin-binding protein 1C [Pseudomonadales bacterium]|nr:penicillin-binding protein 1C [Pseudomonadales bacterium]
MKVFKAIAKAASLLVALVLALLLLLDSLYPMPRQQSFSTVVLASNGEVLRAFSNNRQQWRYPIDNEAVPEHFLTLLLGYEDRWFYHHFGVNPLSMLRAAWQNYRAGRVVSGGSTLTMQVARLLDPHPRSYRGKLQQLLRALQLEWHLDKAQILNLYLNLAPYGGTLIGVQAASSSYFAKPLQQLSDAEAALLAVLPQAPSRLRPDRHLEEAQRARDKVLRRMSALKIWSENRVEDALEEPLFAYNQRAPLIAPLLARRLKKQCQHCEKIHTTIDIEMQQQLEMLVADYVETTPQGLSVALLVMENTSGAVRSYIGSADFLNAERFGHVDMVQAVRSPGSTLKPFLYGLAIDRGIIHSQSLLQDTPRYKKAYRPRNFSGGFNGPVSVTESLQRSLNIPAVQILEQLGAEYFSGKLQYAGLKLQGPGADKPNVAMILGGVGTKLEHLVGAYSALARSGLAIRPKFQLQQPSIERFLLSPGAAWISWKMLAINPVKSARHNRLNGDWQLAWKTGTSYGHREAWALGVSKKWSIGVWVGRPDSSASPGISGRKTAAPLLFKAYRAIGADKPLERPDTVTQQQICWPLGTSVSSPLNTLGNCQQKKLAWILDDTIPPTLSDSETLVSVWRNHRGERVEPACEFGPLQHSSISLWPVSLEPWISLNWRRAARLPSSSEQCSQLLAEQQSIKITSVVNQSLYQYQASGLQLQLLAEGGSGRFDWYLNGIYQGVSRKRQALNLSLKGRGKYQLSVVDQQGNTDLVKFTVE